MDTLTSQELPYSERNACRGATLQQVPPLGGAQVYSAGHNTAVEEEKRRRARRLCPQPATPFTPCQDLLRDIVVCLRKNFDISPFFSD